MSLYTFGCSYTYYNWPTWADILGLEFAPFNYNWGYPGLGNRAIAERVAECHARNTITENDTVIVQWSSPIRHDWMRADLLSKEGTKWRTHGSIFSRENERIFDKKWLDIFWDEKTYLIHTLNNIILTQELLESTGCKWMMTSMNDLTLIGNIMGFETQGGEYQPKEFKLQPFWKVDFNLSFYKEAIWDKYADHWVEPIMSVTDETQEHTWWFDYDPKTAAIEKGYPIKDGKWEEAHPSVTQHAIWMLRLKDKLGSEVSLTDDQKQLIKEIEDIKSQNALWPDFEEAMKKTFWFRYKQNRGI